MINNADYFLTDAKRLPHIANGLAISKNVLVQSRAQLILFDHVFAGWSVGITWGARTVCRPFRAPRGPVWIKNNTELM